MACEVLLAVKEAVTLLHPSFQLQSCHISNHQNERLNHRHTTGNEEGGCDVVIMRIEANHQSKKGKGGLGRLHLEFF